MAETPDPPSIWLELDSRPEHLPLVRGMLAGAGELLTLDSELLDDLKTAVSEACNNVVLHAYGGEPGPMTIALTFTGADIEVLVRDRGSGIQPLAASIDRPGLGLAVITALADHAEFLSAPGGGTDVRMTFAGRAGASRLPELPAGEPEDRLPVEMSGDVVVTVAPAALLSGVLGRLTRALAAVARFSLDRFSDVYMVTDAVAAHAQRAASPRQISFAIAAAESRLELKIGPFRANSITPLVASAPERLPSALTLLADELTVESTDRFELLRVVLLDRRG